MKDWIKKLNDDTIISLDRAYRTRIDIPVEVDVRITEAILRESAAPDERPTAVVRQKVKPVRVQFVFRPVYAIALALILVIPIAWFVFFSNSPFRSTIVFGHGRGELVRGSQGLDPEPGTELRAGDTIRTESGAGRILRIGKNSIVRLFPATEMRFETIDRKHVTVSLASGRIAVHTDTLDGKAPDFEVRTGDLIARPAGTVFSVGIDGDGTEIAVYRHSVDVWRAPFVEGTKPVHRIVEGASAIFGKNGQLLTRPLSQNLIDDFSRFAGLGSLGSGANQSLLTVTSATDDVLLVIDGNSIDRFSQSALVAVTPGEREVRIRKDGYVDHVERLKLAPSERREVSIPPLVGEDGVSSEEDATSESARRTLRLGVSETVYSAVNPDDREMSMIIALQSAGGRLIGMTPASVFAIGKSGGLVWKRDYGKKRKVLFDSPPVVRNGRLYLAANDVIIVLDAADGREIASIASPGILSYGFAMATTGGTGYIPYPEGIYVFDLAGFRLGREPFMSFENGTTPLLFGSSVYITSFVSPVLARFNLQGKPSGSTALDGICMSPPATADGYVFAGDMTGVLHKAGQEMEPAGTVALSGGITSITPVGKKLFVQTNDGKGHLVAAENLDVLSTFVIDAQPDEKAYLYRRPFVKNAYIVLGSDSGAITLINADTGTREQVKDVTRAAVYCAPCEFQGMLFVGTRIGELIKIAYESSR